MFPSPSPCLRRSPAPRMMMGAAAAVKKRGSPININFLREFVPSSPAPSGDDVRFVTTPSPARKGQAKAKAKGNPFACFSPESLDVYPSPPSAAAKGTGKRRREAAGGEYSGRSNDSLRRNIADLSDDSLRRNIADLSDDELRRNIAQIPTFGRLLTQEKRERGQRLLPLLEAEAPRRGIRADALKDGDGRNRAASSMPDVCTFGVSEESTNRGSPATMDMGDHMGSPVKLETGDHSAKKQRLDGSVKQKTVAAGAIVLVEHGPRMEVAMKMDVTVLHCPICLRPFKPPVMQCKHGHLACSGCHHEGACGRCGAPFDVPNMAMDEVVSAAMVQCPHEGCETYVTYHGVQGHQSLCPHAPCWCTEAGCGFVGLAPALVAHLVAAHAMPVNMITYSKAQHIQVTVPERSSSLLVGAGDEGGAFLLASHSLGAATVITAVCIRAEACVWPRYTVKMWVNGPRKAAPAANRKTDNMMTEFEATSSTTPGAVSLEDLTSYLMVPPRYLVGAGPSKELTLNIHIERTTS